MTKEMIHDTAKQLFHEVIDEVCTQLATAAAADARQRTMLQTQFVCDELITDFNSRLIRSVSLLISATNC